MSAIPTMAVANAEIAIGSGVTIATHRAVAVRAAVAPNHFNCWRSTVEPRRNRMTAAAMATGRPTGALSWLIAVRASSTRGSPRQAIGLSIVVGLTGPGRIMSGS